MTGTATHRSHCTAACFAYRTGPNRRSTFTFSGHLFADGHRYAAPRIRYKSACRQWGRSVVQERIVCSHQGELNWAAQELKYAPGSGDREALGE